MRTYIAYLFLLHISGAKPFTTKTTNYLETIRIASIRGLLPPMECAEPFFVDYN